MTHRADINAGTIGVMIETYTYKTALPEQVTRRYQIMETGSAAKIAEAVCPNEFADVIDVLSHFQLTSALLLTKGGSRGPIPRIIDGSFSRRGWKEARVDLYKRAFLFDGQNAPTVEKDPLGERANEFLVSETYQQGYSVDNVKGRIALDVEWNPKDGNLDRDFSAYRAWHEEGLIDVAILVTRIHDETRDITDEAWQEYVSRTPSARKEKQTVEYRTTTTANYAKARERILRGDLGTWPIIVFGIGEKTWDGKPWDGRSIVYNKTTHGLEYKSTFTDEAPEPFDAYL